jgi:hypothetical protein
MSLYIATFLYDFHFVFVCCVAPFDEQKWQAAFKISKNRNFESIVSVRTCLANSISLC